MTNALGIAAVTAVLIDRLNNAVIDADIVADVRISARPPESLRRGGVEPSNRLNIFLYRVERNQGWVNECLPERRSSGERIARSYLALDLHYLMSAYGNSDMEAEILLGYGMQVLHETPVLDRDAIRRSLGSGNVTGQLLPEALQALSPADLADQVEQVKVTHHTLPPEEEWRLWSALNTGLRPSATYKASAVLIESDVSTQSALPVRQARFQVDQIRRPRIDRLLSSVTLTSARRERANILRGQFLVLEGSGLRGLETIVRLGGVDIVPVAAQVTDTEVVVQLPNTTQPGLLSVQIVHRIPRPLPIGVPPITPPPQGDANPMVGELSNAVIAPISVGFDALAAITVTNDTVANGTATADITVRFDHPIGSRQRVSLRLNEFAPPPDRNARALTIDAEAAPTDVDTVPTATFLARAIPAADYLVRVSVDGVDSELVYANGTFTEPRVDLST